MLPLPAVSMPCSTSSSERLSPALPLAYSISCRPAKRSLRSVWTASEPSLEPVYPGLESVSMSAILSPGRNWRILRGSWVHSEGRSAIAENTITDYSVDGTIGEGCGWELNFSSEPPTSTMPHSAFQHSIVR
jgi:hypothetical protein